MYQSWGTSQYKNYVNDYKKGVEKNDMTEVMLILDKMSKIELTRKEYKTILETRFSGSTVFPLLYGYYRSCSKEGELSRRVRIGTSVKMPQIQLGCPVSSWTSREQVSIYDIPITAQLSEEWKKILLEIPQILSIKETVVHNKEIYVHILNRMMKLGFKFDKNEIQTCVLSRSKDVGDGMTQLLYQLLVD